ncbi:unnamed protein product, partial [Bubo scandiacus]
ERAVLHPREKLLSTRHVQRVSASAQERGQQRMKETSREETEGDALRKLLLQEDHMTETKKALLTGMGLKGLRLGSPLTRKGSYLISSPSTPCPRTCNSE